MCAVGLAFAKRQPIKAYEITGSALDPAAQVTKNILTVKELLAPLSREQLGIIECKMEKPKFPVLFYKPPTAIIGPGAPIHIPKVVQPVAQHLPDYEVELTIVIGKAAKDVSPEDALDYVLAYTAANDVSFRYHQMAVSQWGFSKGYDNATPIGPCLVAATALPNPQRVSLKTTLNGQVLQDGNTAYTSSSDQLFGVRETIAFLSQGTTLLPGSIIMTGTPKGVGWVKQPPVYLKNGDNVTIWIDGGIGSLVNPVIEEGKTTAKSKL
ncbi:hypothetical protein EIP86_000330 [Pleurotus ostreatoroseus]|nr:hypothetical protein EIP86_000330 [Pleurotus ostreatoroseus]